MISRIVIQVLVMCFLGWLFCDIDPNKTYSWYSGIWQGIFLPINFIRSLFFDNVLYKANLYTTAYHVFYWIFGISSVLSFFFGSRGRNDR